MSLAGCVSAPPSPVCETNFDTGKFIEISWKAPRKNVDSTYLNPIDDIIRYDIYLERDLSAPVATATNMQRRCRLELEPGVYGVLMTAVGVDGTSDFSQKVEKVIPK
jgi:hypothetical protein